MKIEANKYVAINYILKNDEGVVLDSSEGRGPLGFVFGRGEIIPGLEKELEGKETGAKFNCTIDPAGAYGEYDETLIFDVPTSEFDTDVSAIEIGMAFYAQTAQGPRIVHVLSIQDNMVKLDGNHELAGKTLHFDVEVMEIRDATEEELNPPRGCGGGCGGCGGGCGGDCGSGDCGGECGGDCSCGGDCGCN
ncbi:MAG: peptidylprolyl isomerase [Treponema sp.]|nr:peptidylprolyl isomerase [Treponema sp.]